MAPSEKPSTRIKKGISPSKTEAVQTQNQEVETQNGSRPPNGNGFRSFGIKDDILIEEAEVVSKSYPDFWNDLKKNGLVISER